MAFDDRDTLSLSDVIRGLALLNPERIARWGALLVAICYATGLLVTNVYLARFGVSDFSLLKPRYVLLGVAVLALPALTCLVLSLRVIRWRGLATWKSVGWWIFLTFLFLWLPVWAPFVVAPDLQNYLRYTLALSVKMTALICIVWFVGTLMIALLGLANRHERKADKQRLHRPLWIRLVAGFALVIVAVAFVDYMALFADGFLPHLPDSFGGLKEHSAYFVLEKGDEERIGSEISDKTIILYEGENDFVLLTRDRTTHNSRVVRLPKHVIRAVRIIPEKD